MITTVIVTSFVFSFTLAALQLSAVEKLQKTGYIDGDFVIGALFPVHGSPLSRNDQDPLKCDKVLTQEAIQLVESAFFAVDTINRDESVLPGIKLGITIKDECWSEMVAEYQAIKLIENPTRSSDCCSKSSQSAGSDSKNSTLIAVLGASTSTATTQVQNVLKVFKIPQMGYSATFLDLKYPFFYLSVVPNDYHEAFVILNVIRKLRWNYISIAYTDSYFGVNGKSVLQEWAGHFNVCIAANVLIPKLNGMMYFNAISELFKDQRAKVIVCFCEGPTLLTLYREIRDRNLTGNYVILTSTDWHITSAIVHGYEEEAKGSIIVGRKEKYLPEFDDYFFTRNLKNNQRDPWFEEFWEFRFNCNVNSNENSNLTNCTGNENLRKNYQQGPKVSHVVTSIHALARGLHNMQVDTCRNTSTLCSELFPFNSTKYMDYMMNLNFSFHDAYVNFAFNRSPEHGQYDIFNFQKLPNGSFDYVKISEYGFNFKSTDCGNDLLPQFKYFEHIQFPGESSSNFKSQCSDPCPPGYMQLRGNGKIEKKCCWSCLACQANEILADETTCLPCPLGYWPNVNKTGCVQIPTVYVQWTKLQLMVALTLSSFGIILTMMTAYVFFKYRNTPVVKSSTRELCYVMLFGTLMLYCASFVTAVEPSELSCWILGFLTTTSFGVVYSALLVKTNRIARLLAISKKKFPNLNPRFVSLRAQMMITFGLIMVKIMACAIYYAYKPPYPLKTISSHSNSLQINLECVVDDQIMQQLCIGYDLIIIVTCTYYAIKTRNIPDNFRETKCIGFLTYVACVAYISCGLVFHGSNLKMFTLSLHSSITGYAVLFILFFPKLYIIICVPKKNTREHFATATGIRCIIGRTDILSNDDFLHSNLLKDDLKILEELYLRKLQLTNRKTSKASFQFKDFIDEE